MIRSAAILTAAATMLATACAQQAAAPAAFGPSSSGQCFLSSQVNGFTAVTDEVVLVQVGANRYFRLDLFGMCPNVDWSSRIGIRTTGGSNWICQGYNAELIVPTPGLGPQRCLVKSVRQIGKQEWLAGRRVR
jgi:hypothetical protein